MITNDNSGPRCAHLRGLGAAIAEALRDGVRGLASTKKIGGFDIVVDAHSPDRADMRQASPLVVPDADTVAGEEIAAAIARPASTATVTTADPRRASER